MKLVIALLLFNICTHAEFSRSDHIKSIGKRFNTSVFEFELQSIVEFTFKDIKAAPARKHIYSNKKVLAGNIKKAKKHTEDELVFYSYNSKKKSDKKFAQKNVKPGKLKVDPTKLPLQLASNSIITKNSPPRKGDKSFNKADAFKDYTKLLSAAYEKNTSSKFSIEANLFGLKKSKRLKNFEITPYYNQNDRLGDYGDGSVEIPLGPRGDSTFKGRITGVDVYPTNFEIAVSLDDLVIIPVMSYEKISRILSSEQIDDKTGTHLLVELTENLDSTQLEAKYDIKVLLDKNLNVTDAGNSYRYELYLNASPGNQVFQMMNLKGEITEKILHLSEGEVTYDIPELLGKEKVILNIYEEHLTSLKHVPVDIKGESISIFNTNIKAQKKSANSYEVNFIESEPTFRNYVRIDRKDTLYVGIDRSAKVILPTTEYIDYILNLFSLEKSPRECIIQFNLSKSATEFIGEMTAYRQSANFDIIFMDKDGTVGKELTGLTNKVFVVGNGNGVFNYKLTYSKTDTRYKQSFCNDSLYIVEQL